MEAQGQIAEAQEMRRRSTLATKNATYKNVIGVVFLFALPYYGLDQDIKNTVYKDRDRVSRCGQKLIFLTDFQKQEKVISIRSECIFFKQLYTASFMYIRTTPLSLKVKISNELTDIQ